MKEKPDTDYWLYTAFFALVSGYRKTSARRTLGTPDTVHERWSRRATTYLLIYKRTVSKRLHNYAVR